MSATRQPFASTFSGNIIGIRKSGFALTPSLNCVFVVLAICGNVIRCCFAAPMDWIQPCHVSRRSCDNVCGVEKRLPLFWTCHNDTGYCLCPVSSDPGAHCRRIKTRAESHICQNSVCVGLKKKMNNSKESSHVDRETNIQKIAAHALICINEETNTQHCTCFAVKST